jgi:hypothetical protein
LSLTRFPFTRQGRAREGNGCHAPACLGFCAKSPYSHLAYAHSTMGIAFYQSNKLKNLEMMENSVETIGNLLDKQSLSFINSIEKNWFHQDKDNIIAV